MALSIRNRELEKLARALAELTGHSMTEEILLALEERKALLETGMSKLERLKELCRACAALPDLDTRSAEDILDYDEQGLFLHGS